MIMVLKFIKNCATIKAKYESLNIKKEQIVKKAKVTSETNDTENEVVPPLSGKKTVTKVGSLLKEMRLEKGLRLPDVSKRLCIRKLYLEAIEESDYDEIPAFPYGVGFIRSYAEYLGLNGDNIVDLYKEETNATPDKNIYVLEPQGEANVPNRKYLLISLLAIVLVYLGWSLYTNKAENTSPTIELEVESNISEHNLPVVENYIEVTETTDVADITPEESIEQVVITEEPFVEKTTENSEITTEENKVQDGVVIKVIEETWVEVKDDSKLYLSKVLKPGTEYIVPEGGKGIILSIGKVDGAEVYINGKLTKIARPNKKTNIALDPFLATAH